MGEFRFVKRYIPSAVFATESQLKTAHILGIVEQLLKRRQRERAIKNVSHHSALFCIFYAVSGFLVS